MAATDSRSKLANPITQHSDTPRLVESQPMLDPITEPLEADPSVVCIVPNDLRGLPAVVPFVEGGGEVPAGHEHERNECECKGINEKEILLVIDRAR